MFERVIFRCTYIVLYRVYYIFQSAFHAGMFPCSHSLHSWLMRIFLFLECIRSLLFLLTLLFTNMDCLFFFFFSIAGGKKKVLSYVSEAVLSCV